MGDHSAAIVARNSISGKAKEGRSYHESYLQVIPLSGSFIANTVGILMLTFSGGQGAIVVNYRIEEKKLVSMKEGKDVTGWRWKQ